MNVIQEKAMTGGDCYRGSSPHFAQFFLNLRIK